MRPRDNLARKIEEAGYSEINAGLATNNILRHWRYAGLDDAHAPDVSVNVPFRSGSFQSSGKLQWLFRGAGTEAVCKIHTEASKLRHTSTPAPASQGQRGSIPRGPRRGSPTRRPVTLLTAAGRLAQGTGQGATFQISVAYWEIVRSLENFPEPAILRIALAAHPSSSA